MGLYSKETINNEKLLFIRIEKIAFKLILSFLMTVIEIKITAG